ncbi:hypothetical protein NUU61_003034 [Penicillium alfredii]|uniref:Apple domain-containing protein n=1 Tax=Penicillium alfredii TaxID=1506179 RepID=A0A9W9FST6_9EURO|nr:uncharacterized protein NUU61_003034 [Penicillium alfredii]KAJ5105687.1 hypothetical protein NUU61_003034 [Penicillium alfredii]
MADSPGSHRSTAFTDSDGLTRGARGLPDDLHARSPEEPKYLVQPPPQQITVPEYVDKPQRRICGLVPSSFWLLLALIVVIIAAAIGGGVGGSLSVKHCNDNLSQCRSHADSLASDKKSSSTNCPSTTNTTSSSAPADPTTGCKPEDGSGAPSGSSDEYSTHVRSPNAPAKFKKYCGSNMSNRDQAAIITQSWENCMEACGVFNINNMPNQTCFAVAFVPSWTQPEYSLGNISAWANCFLKAENTSIQRLDSPNTVLAVLESD